MNVVARSRWALVLGAVVLSAVAVAAEAADAAATPKRLTLLITGDNRGEIAPCG